MSTRSTMYLILVILFNIILTVNCKLGDDCQTTQGQDGICTTRNKCEEALQDIERNVKPTTCGTHEQEIHVCCVPKSFYRVGDITKEKCNEYMGLEKSVGTIADVRSGSEFPHVVALGYGNENDIKWHCGGSLISENYILTAAHCLISYDGEDVKFIRAGTKTLFIPESTYQDFKVVKSIFHPKYDDSKGYHDIALIKLDKSIKVTKYVKPACLYTAFKFDGDLWATGWGPIYSGSNPSDELRKVNLVQSTNSHCNLTYSKNVLRLPNGIQEQLMICAEAKPNKQNDLCQGDSGGPLQITTPYHTIIGITSFGKGCNPPNRPRFYTRVSNYIEWIEKAIWM